MELWVRGVCICKKGIVMNNNNYDDGPRVHPYVLALDDRPHTNMLAMMANDESYARN